MNVRYDSNSPSEQYADAYQSHYAIKDLEGALEAYCNIIATHPDSREAGYARSQVQNLANAVVPKQMLHDSNVKLLLSCFATTQATQSMPDSVST